MARIIENGSMSKTGYEDSVSYHMPTMELKRKSILGYLEMLLQMDIDSGFCLNYHGYFRTENLENEIAYTMGWVKEVPSRPHHTVLIVPDIDQYSKIQQTIQNMAAKGHIKLSKSGKGFRILDTWRN